MRWYSVTEGKRVPRKKGQPANSKKHSDLYTDENPKGTIHGLGFKDEASARSSVSKIRKSGRSHAHKIQAAVAMEQRAKAAGKTGPASIYRKYINSMKKKTKAKQNEEAAGVGIVTKQNATKDVPVGGEYMNVKKLGLGKGKPKKHPKKVRGSKTNVLFNLGMAENLTESERLDELLPAVPAAVATAARVATSVLPKIAKNPSHLGATGAGTAVGDKVLKQITKSRDANKGVGLKGRNLRAKQLSQKNATNEVTAQDLSKDSEVYVDMDGVLADFFGAWKKLVGTDWREIKDLDSALQKIRDKDDFWLNIPVTSNAMNLLSLIKELKGKYNILSAPLPNDPNAEPHKREWVKKNLSAFPPSKVIITSNKSVHATQPDGTPNILIDDFGKNIAKWEAAGGVGFKHKDHKFERTVKNLKAYMNKPVEEAPEDEIKKIKQTAGAIQKAQSMMKPRYSSEIAALVEDEFEAVREAALRRYKKAKGKIDLYTAYTMAIEDEFPEIPNPIFVFQYMTDPIPEHEDLVPQEAEDGSWADRADKDYQQKAKSIPKGTGFDPLIKGRWFAIKADRDSYMDQGMEPEDALEKAAERHGVDPEEVEKWIAAGNAVKIKENYELNEYVQYFKILKYGWKTGTWLWNNKWAIAFLTVSWKTFKWIGDAIAFIKPFLDNPIVRGLAKYGLPAVGVAVALYGGKKLYDQITKAEDEKDLEKILSQFEADQEEIAILKKELEILSKRSKTTEAKMSKSSIKSIHKTADKIKDKPKAKKSIGNWAKERGMDPEGAIYAIATNMKKRKQGKKITGLGKESYTRDELPQIRKQHLDYIPHTMETVQVKDVVPVQKERLKENHKKQLYNILDGRFNPIVVDCYNRIVNGHHRYDILKMLKMESTTVAKLPFTLEFLLEIDRRGFLKGLGATAAMAMLPKAAKALSNDKEQWYVINEKGRLQGPMDRSKAKSVSIAYPKKLPAIQPAPEGFEIIIAQGSSKNLNMAFTKAEFAIKKIYARRFPGKTVNVNRKIIKLLGRAIEAAGSSYVATQSAYVKKTTEESVEEGNLLANPQRSVLVKKKNGYDWYKIGTNMANITQRGIDSAVKKDKPDIMLQFYGGEKEKKYMMKNLKRMGYDVQDADGYNDTHFDEEIENSYRLRVSLENFADGKKKGRKGLSKRVGIPKGASVTQLRKIAKNSTGERRRMAHWQANMKSGRKKKGK
tara:strand:+ start:2086 stop:5688 length:3603 start_codon:yes stop_codon:yes gene_type:complete